MKESVFDSYWLNWVCQTDTAHDSASGGGRGGGAEMPGNGAESGASSPAPPMGTQQALTPSLNSPRLKF